MSSEPTNAEKIRLLPWNTALNAANTIFAQFTFFGPAFVLFLSELNFNNTEIGFLLSTMPFFGLVALFIAPAVARFGYKRTFVTFFAIRKVVTAFLLLVPWVMVQFGGSVLLIYISAIMMGFALCRAIAETGIYPWAQEYIPNSIRGKYAAVNDIFSRIAAVIATGVASYVLEQNTGLDRFMFLFAVGLIFGAIAVWTSTHIPGGAPVKDDSAEKMSYGDLVKAARDSNFVLYLAAFSLIVIGTTPMLSFLPLFMRERVGLSDSVIVLLQMGTLFGGLTSTYLVGWAADRYGSKPVMISGIILKLLLPIGWALMPRASDLSAPVAFALSIVFGIGEIAWAIGVTRLLYVGVVPADKKAQYMAVFYAAMGIIGGISQLAGGWFLDLSKNISGQFVGIVLDPFTPLFVLGLVLPAISIWLFQRVKADSNVGVAEFAGMFIRGNPFMAFESMVRYYRAKDEHKTVIMTERLGQTKSPLMVDELLEALRDPRFNVRFEAIISSARMPPDPRLVEALINILKGTELSLTVISAWALGRIGDTNALPALREGLDSEYRSIRAHCARALGTLKDRSVIPELDKRLQTETDKGLQVAYAAALGNLGAEEAAGTLFTVLKKTENEGARMELSLSVARLIGEEQRFIRLLRQMRQDTATAEAQAVIALRRKFAKAPNPELKTVIEGCADTLAHGEFDRGAEMLSRLISLLPEDTTEDIVMRILHECAERLDEFGARRVEYIVLTLHALAAVE
jgi:MFS family permease